MGAIVLTIHIIGGSIGLLSGNTALFARKGSGLHLRAGNIFFLSMLVMSATGTIISLMAEEVAMASFMAGSITFYMVVTSWSTARSRDGKIGQVERAALLYILILSSLGVVTCWNLVNSGQAFNGGLSSAMDFFHFFYTGIAVLALILDIKVNISGGIYGAQRIARHLWRMCFALWVATGSFFLGQGSKVFPDYLLNKPLLLSLPWILVTFMLFFWLIRVYLIRRFKKREV